MVMYMAASTHSFLVFLCAFLSIFLAVAFLICFDAIFVASRDIVCQSAQQFSGFRCYRVDPRGPDLDTPVQGAGCFLEVDTC